MVIDGGKFEAAVPVESRFILLDVNGLFYLTSMTMLCQLVLPHLVSCHNNSFIDPDESLEIRL